MLTYEIYNPTTLSKKFLRKADGRTYHFGADGILYNGGGSPAMQVQIGEEWELVRQEADFMTAVNSGKAITSKSRSFIWCMPAYVVCSGNLTLEDINGKWLIE